MDRCYEFRDGDCLAGLPSKVQRLQDLNYHLAGQLASALDLGNTYCRENGVQEGITAKECIHHLAYRMAEFRRRLAILEAIHYGPKGTEQRRPPKPERPTRKTKGAKHEARKPSRPGRAKKPAGRRRPKP